MKELSFSLKYIFLLVILASGNCAFASFEKKCVYSKIDSATAPSNFIDTGYIENKLVVNGGEHKIKKAKKGGVALVVISGVLLAVTLAFFVFIAAWGGASSALLTVIGIVGLALIIFGATRIIRRIKRKRATEHGTQ